MLKMNPHEEYINKVARLKEYHKDVKKALKGLKVGDKGIEGLINDILSRSKKVIGKHWKDSENHHYGIDFETLRAIFEENEDEIKEKGLTDELIEQLAGIYHNQAGEYVKSTYKTKLTQMDLEDAKESLSNIARYAGFAEHIKTSFPKIKKHSTLVQKLELYHDRASQRTQEMIKAKLVKPDKAGNYNFEHFAAADSYEYKKAA